MFERIRLLIIALLAKEILSHERTDFASWCVPVIRGYQLSANSEFKL
jgi:hypothetical protein